MLKEFLANLATRMRAAEEKGRVADYIPELAQIDPGQFGVSICLADGTQISAGDAETYFSIQSVSRFSPSPSRLAVMVMVSGGVSGGSLPVMLSTLLSIWKWMAASRVILS